MAAFDSPWLHSISPGISLSDMGTSERKTGWSTPTSASFSPAQSGSTQDRTKTLLLNQKSPLLITTPPQITRALAFSHPFLLPLSHLMGLLSWSTGDPWESYLLVASFWALILYGDALIRWTGPIFMVGILIGAMYSRRYSPLSTKSTSDLSAKSDAASIKHQKSLDEIVDALNVFTSRCQILVDPWLQMTEFLSTQLTPTTSTTKPALMSLLVRILMVSPIWVALTLPPLHIVSSRRVILIIGTISLTWHSRPARVCRTLLWRSMTIRHISATLTGLDFAGVDVEHPPALPPRKATQQETALSVASKSKGSPGGVRFTFVVYENQRRWLGLGWTSAMLAYERASWTDENLNPSSPKEKFPLPKVEGGHAVWRWVPGDDWKTEGAKGSSEKSKNEAWIYYDNKWNHGRKQDGWGQYTRRRKWYRDAELVEVNTQTPAELSGEVPTSPNTTKASIASGSDQAETIPNPRKGLFRRTSKTSTKSSLSKTLVSDDDDNNSPISSREGIGSRFGFNEDLEMSLG